MLTASSSHQASVSVPEEERQLTWRQSKAPDPAHEQLSEPAEHSKPQNENLIGFFKSIS